MIAVDAMGGDYAPEALVHGSLQAAKKGVSITLFGPQKQLEKLLHDADPTWQQHALRIHDAPDYIEMDEDPVAAIKRKPRSSLVQAIKSVKAGLCHGVLSAGNSGALLTGSIFILGRKNRVRPAIIGYLPARREPVLALDMGANADCRPQHLYDFAHMGHEYVIDVLKRDAPRIGLLSNGHEDRKGSLLTKEAFALLKKSTLNFVGNVEPVGIFNNEVDLVVCDGFSGNILIKTMEAMFDFTSQLLAQDIAQADSADVKKWGAQFLVTLSNQAGSRTRGGALLLGVNGKVIVCHGDSDAQSIERAIFLVKGAGSQSSTNSD